MRRIVLVALGVLSCAAFATEVFPQAGQTVNPVPITPPTLNTTTLTCQINCDTQAMSCLNTCVPITGSPAQTGSSVGTNPAVPAGVTSACNLSCTTQQLVCKQRC